MKTNNIIFEFYFCFRSPSANKISFIQSLSKSDYRKRSYRMSYPLFKTPAVESQICFRFWDWWHLIYYSWDENICGFEKQL